MERGAVLYVRVSTEEQVSNLSLDTQERACRELCGRLGLDVLAVFREEGASAKTADRAELQKLLLFVERQRRRVGSVVVYQLSRFARNQIDHFALRLRLERAGVVLRSATEPVDDSPTGRLLEGVVSAVAEFDNRIRAARTLAGMREAVERGRWTWSAPVGYRHAPRRADGSPGGLELDPERAPLVRMAFELVAAGSTIEEARREVAAAGLLRAGGRPIARQTFHQLLRRELYAGRLVVGRWEIEVASAAPAIVDGALFARVQQRLEGVRPARHRTATLSDFPLRGLVRCTCGRRLSAYRARGRGGKLYPYFRCPSCAVNVALADLERAFEALLGASAALPGDLDLVDRMVSTLLDRRAGVLQERLVRARRRLATAEGRIERLVGLRTDGEIGPEEFATARRRTSEERDAAAAELADLTDVPAVAGVGLGGAWVRRLLTRPAEVWRELAGDQRATLAARLFPDGLTWSDGACSNRGKPLLLLPLATDFSADSGLVPPAGRSSNPPEWAPLVWCQQLQELQAAVFGRAT